jgi:hypothetical protein
MELIYDGSKITEEHKKKRGLFFLEELFVGNFNSIRAPLSLRKKMDSDVFENIELDMKCFFGVKDESKIVFKNYTHFRKILKRSGISLKQYFKE